MSLHLFIQDIRPMIELKIHQYFNGKIASLQNDSLAFHAVSKLYIGVLGGKMIRGMMTILGFKIGKNNLRHTDIFSIALAIEIMHTALLVHDDIMDDDYKRRGEDTIYHYYQKIGREYKADNPKLYGQALALCVGDIAFFMVYDLLTKHISSFSKLKKIIAFYSSELYQVGYAQMADVHYGQMQNDLTYDKIIDIYKYKTARYTFTLPFSIGGILGDLNKKDLSLLQQFGEELGIIFQIRDDELGIFGNEIQIGKTVGSDIRENKKTLLRFLLLQKLSSTEKKNVDGIFGNKTIEINQIDYIRTLIKRYHIREDINRDINLRTKKLKALLSQLSIDAKNKKTLEDLVEYNLKRFV